MQKPDAGLSMTFDLPKLHGLTTMVLRVRGEVDAGNAHTLYAAVRAGIKELASQDERDPIVEHPALMIDLRGVSFMGAAGWNSLVVAATDSPRPCAPVRLVVDHNRPVVRPAALLGLDEVFVFYDDLTAAATDPAAAPAAAPAVDTAVDPAVDWRVT